MSKSRRPFRSIATRLLSIQGSRAKIKVEIGRPYPVKNDYGCDFKISYRGKIVKHAVYGADAFQSLQLALRLLPTCLRHGVPWPVKKTYLHELGDDMGFPEVIGT
jgi:hypothetical protein